MAFDRSHFDAAPVSRCAHTWRGAAWATSALIALGFGADRAAGQTAGDSVTTAWKLRVDNIISASAQWRMQARRCVLIGADNGGCATAQPVDIAQRWPLDFSQTFDLARLNQDDGNLNFARGDVVSAALRWSSDIGLSGPDGWGARLYLSSLFDDVALRGERTPLQGQARRQIGRDTRVLDAFITRDFALAGQPARVKIGNQVINWGEALFSAGGVGATNALDLTKLHAAGAPLKEVMLPAPMVSTSLPLARGWSIEGYWQGRWNASRLDPAGSFFSANDLIGRGARAAYLPTSLANTVLAGQGLPTILPSGSTGDEGTTVTTIDPQTGQVLSRRYTAAEFASPSTTPLYRAITGTGSSVPRGEDVQPRVRGQWGLALRTTIEGSGNEWALYYLRYHDKLPMASIRIDTTSQANPFLYGSLFSHYAQDRELLGLSTNLRLGDWSLGAELSIRPREAVPIDPTAVVNPAHAAYCNGDLNPANYVADGTLCRGWVDRRKQQLAISGLRLLRANDGALGWLMGLLGASDGSLAVETVWARYPDLWRHGPQPFAATSDYRSPTVNSYGLSGQLLLNIPQVGGTNWTLSPELNASMGLGGISASLLPGLVKGVGQWGLALTVDFRTEPALKLRAEVNRPFGSANPLRDRGWGGLSLSSSF